jgi:hypothetical protein
MFFPISLLDTSRSFTLFLFFLVEFQPTYEILQAKICCYPSEIITIVVQSQGRNLEPQVSLPEMLGIHHRIYGGLILGLTAL